MMLSAVAARKAARATAEASSSKPPSPPPPSRSPSPSPKPTTAPKPTSKRKPRVSSSTGSSKSKKVKVAHASSKHECNARYFNPGEPSDVRNGVSIADSNPKPGVNSESESSSGEDLEIKIDVLPPVGPSSIPIETTKRAWSPSRPIPDSSEDEEAGSGSFDPTSFVAKSTQGKTEPSPLSTFCPESNRNIFQVPENEYATDRMARILVLHPNETLALIGAYSFCVLHGSLSLLGVTLSPSNTKHLVFAPRSSPIPVLSWAALNRQGSCTFPIPQAIRGLPNITVILIEYTDTGVEGLGQICKVFENIFKPPRESDAVSGFDLPRIHLINHSTKSIYPFVLPASWEAVLSSIDSRLDSEMSTTPVCLVKGPKKSGKSTLARTLVNRFLSRYRRVAFLECDLGQSEFTPGGLVALNLVENHVFGPPFTHTSLPYRAHYIGSTSPRASPSHYLCSIQSLLETYKLDLQFPPLIDEPLPGDQRIHDAVPLVVNTMGWTKGLGTDLNARIEELTDPSHVFEIDGAEEKGWPTPVQSQHVPQTSSLIPFMQTSVRQYVKVAAVQTEMMNTYYTATDHRHLNILSYFHSVFPEPPVSSLSGPVLKQITATSWETSLPLCARYPYEVDYTQAFDRAYLTGAGSEDVVPSELTRVLNGAIAGLVSCGPANIFSRPTPSTSQESLLSYTPGDPPPDPALSTCHGLALIRGLPLTLNPRSPHMHILTPLPTGLLSQTRVLVKGEMELPIWGMLDFREDDEGKVAGIEKGHVPYLQWGKGEGVGGEKRRVRRNLMRKGQV